MSRSAARRVSPSVILYSPVSALRSKIKRKPSRVSHGSWCWTEAHWATIRSARPPVAITDEWPSSLTIRSTMPSTMEAVPRTSPAWTLSTVLRAMTVRGGRISTMGSLAAASNSARAEILSPGKMTPPR